MNTFFFWVINTLLVIILILGLITLYFSLAVLWYQLFGWKKGMIFRGNDGRYYRK